MLGGACSSGKGHDAASSTSTSAEAATTVPTAPGRTLAAPPRTCSTDIVRGSSSPPPQQGAALGDGQYFGYITLLDAENLELQFDVAQLLTGDAAVQAAKADGGESPPPNDYWIRNNTKAARTLALAHDATICLSGSGDPTKNEQSTLARLNTTLGDGEPLGVWIDVRSGTVQRVEQQYFP
ncbi:MAG: hypothetical protein QOE35_948 [Actinomycetota bacterium]